MCPFKASAIILSAAILCVLLPCCDSIRPYLSKAVGVRENRSHRITRYRRDDHVGSRNTPSRDFGALYFAYHRDPARAAQYVAAVASSAASLKRYDPDVPVAVLTNAHISHESAPGNAASIDMFLPIQDKDIIDGRASKKYRQWWTRTLYLNATPFDLTLQIDSDRTVCSSIKHLPDLSRDYDMLHVSASILPGFDNGVMVYRKGWRFQALVDQWLAFMERDNKIGDDQSTLARALNVTSRANGFKSGVLPPTYQTKMIPAVGERWGTANASHTLVLAGDVKIVAGDQGLCDLAARHVPRARVIARNGTRATVALSQSECDAFLGGRCRTHEMDWAQTSVTDVLERTEYIARVKASP